MLTSLFMKREKVHTAQSREEREAIYRLRYRVYIEELNKNLAENVDHERKWIIDEQDEQEGTMLFYTGAPPDITGTVRINRWEPGQAPPEIQEKYSFQLFPGIEELVTGEAGRLIIKPSLRGKMILPALARAAYEYACTGEKGLQLVFQYCAPGLVRGYQRLGWRPYPGEVISTEDGIRVPLVLVPSDVRHLREVGSPLAPIGCKFFGPGKKECLDQTRFTALLDSRISPYELDAEMVWQEIQDELLTGGRSSPLLLDNLTDAQVKMLISKGFMMEVPAGKTIIRQDLVEKEMFLIVEGVFEVVAGEKRVTILNKGDVFGEIALFLASGKRTAHVRSLTPGKVLILRRKFIDELSKRDSQLGHAILTNLCRILAERLAGMTHSYGSME